METRGPDECPDRPSSGTSLGRNCARFGSRYKVNSSGGGMHRLLPAAVLIFALSTSLFAQPECDQVQKAVDQLSLSDAISLQSLQQSLPKPLVTQSAVVSGKVRHLLLVYQGCYAQFSVNSEGSISSKAFTTGNYQPPRHPRQLPESWHPQYIPLCLSKKDSADPAILPPTFT